MSEPEQFILSISGSRRDGSPFPSPVGPFESRAVAWAWWHEKAILNADPKFVTEVEVEPLHRP